MLHQVGVGALGPVFRTYEPTRDRLVAVKVFRLDVTPEQAQSLADELSTAADAGLFHPSIVEPVAAGVEGTVAYRAEEYVAAETLDVALRHYAPAPIDKVLPLITQLAGAIDFARTAGVGHGALHPRDIFVTPEEARATGFGVVEALERVGLRAPVRRPYSAPERVSGGAWSTPADVFSLAAIAYELLTGRRPAGTGAQIGSVSGTSAGPHPGALHAVFVQAMDEDPVRRYQTALGFASELDAAARGEAPMATYERGAAGAAASAASVVSVAKPEPPVASRHEAVADEPLAGGAGADDEAQDEAVTGRDEDDPRVAFLRGAADEDEDDDLVHGERSLFNEEALEDLTLDGAAAIQTQRFADEFSVAAADATDDSARRTLAIPFDRDDDLSEEEEPVAVGTPASAPYRHITTPSLDEEDAPRGPAYMPMSSAGPIQQDRPRSLVLPIALSLLFGLLLGAGAYAWFMRAPSSSERTADRAPAVTASDPAKPYSEEAITSSGPTRSGQTGASATAAAETLPVGPDTATAPTGDKPSAAPAREEAPTTGRVVVSSTPRGAGVTVDGRWRGRTPLTLDKLPFGSHQVRVVQPGYVPQDERVTLSSGTPARTLSFTLQRTPAAARPSPPPARAATSKPTSFTGSIYVDSRPRGARVLLDGKNIGTTPMRIPDVRIGSHIIRLQLEDHSDWTSSTRVVSGQESRVTGSLERIR